MKPLTALIVICILGSCAPASHINNVPRSSLLKQKGDLNVRAGAGVDTKRLGSSMQFGAAWSPIERIGIEAEYSGSASFNFSDFYHFNSSLIYYIPFENEANLEIKFGYGVGAINKRDNFFEDENCDNGNCDDNQIGVIFGRILEDGFIVNNRSRTFHGQINYNIYDYSDDVHVAFGVRSRRISFDEYFYQTKGDSLAASFSPVTIDPFINVNKDWGPILLDFGLSYTFIANGIRTDKRLHPHFSKLGVAFGIRYRFNY